VYWEAAGETEMTLYALVGIATLVVILVMLVI
jgi:hypothetical protein